MELKKKSDAHQHPAINFLIKSRRPCKSGLGMPKMCRKRFLPSDTNFDRKRVLVDTHAPIPLHYTYSTDSMVSERHAA